MINSRNIKQPNQLATPKSPRSSPISPPHSHSHTSPTLAPPITTSPSTSFSSTSISPRNSITSFKSSIPHSNSNSTSRSSSNASNYSITGNTTTSNSVALSPKRYSFSEYSNEQIIDLMEREQDAIVLKLMKEIEFLKQENKSLKMSSNNHNSNSNNNNNVPPPIMTPPIRRSSSLSSTSSRSSSIRNNSISSANHNNNNSSCSNPQMFNYSFRDNLSHYDETIKKHKGETYHLPISRKSSLNGNKYEEIIDENRSLKRELKKLQGELELLKKKN
ncbi:hypothetical protein SBY92_004323 [Candida maltosa Xu316]|uniref:Uncharacterized protein n=1 Tax=Candida maltosa (strain Xu316) TaxID=1245528 RepID=M3HN52_CANMX|nr:hypothetical protein G210_0453 [Candida maltosa Xu316]